MIRWERGEKVKVLLGLKWKIEFSGVLEKVIFGSFIFIQKYSQKLLKTVKFHAAIFIKISENLQGTKNKFSFIIFLVFFYAAAEQLLNAAQQKRSKHKLFLAFQHFFPLLHFSFAPEVPRNSFGGRTKK